MLPRLLAAALGAAICASFLVVPSIASSPDSDAVATPQSDGTNKLPVPSDNERNKAVANLRQELDSFYSDPRTSPAAIAETLLGLSTDLESNPVQAYAYWYEAINLAGQGLKVDLVETAVDRIVAAFDVSYVVIDAHASAAIAPNIAKDSKDRLELLERCLFSIEACLKAEKYEAAVAVNSGLRGKAVNEPSLRERALVARVKAEACERAAGPRELLKKNPSDPGANFAMARFELIVRDDAKAAMERFVKSGKKGFVELARGDLLAPEDPGAMAQMGHAWIGRGQAIEDDDDLADALIDRGVYWLMGAYEDLSGVAEMEARNTLQAVRPGLGLEGPAAAPAKVVELPDPNRREAVPADDVAAQLRAKIKRSNADAYGETGFADRRALAKHLWDEQAGSMADPDYRYVLLDECMGLAIKGKAFDLFDLCRAQLLAAYALDETAFREDSLRLASKRAQGSAAVAFSELALVDLGRCVGLGEIEAAERIDAVATDIVEDQPNKGLRREYRAALHEMRRARKGLAALEALKESPFDSELHMRAGRYLAFDRGKVEEGFEHLRYCGKKVLAGLAAEEQLNPQDPKTRMDLAERWMIWAAKTKVIGGKDFGMERAAAHLELVKADKTAGVQAAKAKLRLDEIVQAQLKRKGSRRSRAGGPSRRGAPKPVVAAVDLGIAWLIAAQSKDGTWSGTGDEEDLGHVPGRTGLAILAILSSGDPTGDPAVADGVRALVNLQDKGSGLFGGKLEHDFLYDHAVATWALAEAERSGRFGDLLEPVQRATDFIGKSRNPYKVWRYASPPDGENDTSVTGWIVIALTAARTVGARIDTDAFGSSIEWLDAMTDPDTGRCGYMERGTTSSRVRGVNMENYPADDVEALTAVALHLRHLLGQTPSEAPVMQKHAALIQKAQPKYSEDGSTNDLYYWFHGALAMDTYRKHSSSTANPWLKTMEGAVLEGQTKKGPRKGSWAPIGPWGHAGGRVYSTALSVMCLTTAWSRRFTPPAKERSRPVSASSPAPQRKGVK